MYQANEHPTDVIAAERADDLELRARESARLPRTLSRWANTAMTYAANGTSAGLFSLFAFGLLAGGAMFWGWVVVGLGSFLVAFSFAELSSHYPFAGAMYQWPAILIGRRFGWWVGWFYLFATIFILAAYYFILPSVVAPLFNVTLSTGAKVAIAGIALGIAAVTNALGMDVLGRLTKYSVALELSIFLVLTTLVLIFAGHHSVGHLFTSNPKGQSFGSWVPAALAFAVPMTIWSLGQPELNSTFGEDTKDAHERAPYAMLTTWTGCVGVSGLFILVIVVCIPSMSAVLASANPIGVVIDSALPNFFASLYLVIIGILVLLGANAYYAGITRQLFSLARDHRVPGSKALSRVNSRGATPVAVLVIFVLSGIPFIFSQDLAVLATGAAGVYYGTLAVTFGGLLVARRRGWPHGRKSAFALPGRTGWVVNVLALLFTAAICTNLMWPRDVTNPVWKLGIRAGWWLVLIPLVIGVIYYFTTQARMIREEERDELGSEDAARAATLGLESTAVGTSA